MGPAQHIALCQNYRVLDSLLFNWPVRRLRDALTLRQLRRRMPNAHRLWVVAENGIRPENDREYLARLQRLARDRVSLRG
jgi:hypothetical protein